MKNNTHAGHSAGTRFRTYLASAMFGLALVSSPFDLAFAAPHSLPTKVQSLVDTTIQQRWPEQQAFAPVTAVRQEKIDEQRSIYLLQINYEGFVILVEQGEQVRLVAYGQHGGEDLYPQDGALQEWLAALTRQLKKGQTKGDAESKPAAFSAPLAASVPIPPLTTSTWGQSGFYNDATPPDGSTVPTGCVATALAQAMRYFQHPVRPKPSTISYTHQTTTADGKPFSYGVLSADLAQVEYQWAAMPDALSAANSQVAGLMYHLGVGLKMRYRPGFSSNAYFDDVPPAMRNYFGYDISNQIFRSNYGAEQWQGMIDGELNQQRVLVMCGYDYDRGAGHCWVVDGRDDKNFYHMNWGWDGRFNGYFSLTDPAVMGYDFSGYNHIFTLKPSCYVEPRAEVLSAQQVRLSNSGYASNNQFSYRRVGETNWTVRSTDQGQLLLDGLQANSSYEYKVASQCSRLGRNESAVLRFDTPTASQNYCSASGTNSNYEWIDKVASGATVVQSGANNGYADFSHIRIAAKAGQSLNLSLSPGYSVAQPYALYWSVWLDKNQDGAWSSDELLWQSHTAGVQNAQLAVPSNLAAGTYRLRIVMSYYPNAQACGQFQYGEVEDYSVQVAP